MLQWIVENWVALSGALVALLTFAKIVAKMTPNKTDDAIVEKAEEIEKMAGSVFATKKRDPSLAPTEVIVK